MVEPDFYSGIKSSNNTYLSRDEVFRALKEEGVDRAVVEFSGGHDEGGANGVYLERFVSGASGAGASGAGASEAEDDESWERVGELREHVWPGRRGLTGDEVEEMKLAQSLTAPVYDAYHSFAGDFFVSGTLQWRVAGHRVSMHGHESVEHYEGFEMEC